MPNTNTGLPGIPTSPVVDRMGLPTPIWWQFFLSLWSRTGGASGTPSLILDTITDVAGSILYRGASAWLGLNPGAQFKSLRMGAAFPEWDLVDGNSFGSQPAGLFFASPTGAAGIPGFFNPLGQYPGTSTGDDALAGNLGEYVFSEIDTGAAVAVLSATPTDVTSIALTPGDWDVWGSIATKPAGTTTTSVEAGWISPASATDPGAPNAGAYVLERDALAAGLATCLPVGRMRITVPAGPNQTVYLSTQLTFAASTMAAYGFLGARRAR